MAASRTLVAALMAVAPWAPEGRRCPAQRRQFFTTGEPGDQPGFECLACPIKRSDAYRLAPNDHPPTFSGAELFVLDYWDAMTRGDLQWLMDSYAGSGTLIRAGGPPMMGNFLTALGQANPFNGSLGYDTQGDKGGLIYFFYSTGNAKWRGEGGLFSNATGNDGVHTAFQDIVQVSDDFAIVTTIINGTQYSRTTAQPLHNWTSMKQSITVRNFGGAVGWKIVHFTCSFYSFSWLGENGTKCMPGASTGIPPPHVDWSAAGDYSVKFTDQANYCSRRCTCGEAPVADKGCEEAPIPNQTEYRNQFFLTDVPGAEPGGFCLHCPTDATPSPSFPDGSAERFILGFVRALGAGDPAAASQYSEHAVLVRNGGPAITGPPSTSSPGGNGLDFFTHLWPGLTYVGSGGALRELQVAPQRVFHAGPGAAQMLLFTNGTLYNQTSGQVAVPWVAKRLAVSVLKEGSGPDAAWKVVGLSALDYNANGVSRCTYDGMNPNNSYCLYRCPCGEVLPLSAEQAAAENVTYRTVASTFV